jgi:hypothetical protein
VAKPYSCAVDRLLAVLIQQNHPRRPAPMTGINNQLPALAKTWIGNLFANPSAERLISDFARKPSSVTSSATEQDFPEQQKQTDKQP